MNRNEWIKTTTEERTWRWGVETGVGWGGWFVSMQELSKNKECLDSEGWAFGLPSSWLHLQSAEVPGMIHIPPQPQLSLVGKCCPLLSRPTMTSSVLPSVISASGVTCQLYLSLSFLHAHKHPVTHSTDWVKRCERNKHERTQNLFYGIRCCPTIARQIQNT